MKVLHILRGCDVGGVEWFVHNLVKTQKHNNELDLGLICCKKKGDLKNKFLQLNIKSHFINFKPFEKNIFKYTKIYSIIKSYDLIHLHSYMPIISLILLLTNVKVLYTNHSVFGYGRRRDFIIKFKNKLKILFLNNKNIHITSNSEYTKNFWKNEGVKNKNSKVIYNGVKFKHVAKELSKIDLDLPEKFLVGTTCRLIEWKRVNLLIKAFFRFQKNKKDVHLVIVGDGNQRSKLQKLVIDLEINEKVSFIGNVLNVEQYQSLFDVCVFPSTTEAFGLVAIECMIFGKPVIVMKDGGGITEILQKIEPENVVKDIKSLSSKLEDYYKGNNNALMNKEKASRRKAFAESFDMNKTEKEFYKLYYHILTH